MNKNHIVTQSNNLIEARHVNPLTAREQKIVLTMVSMVEPFDDDFKHYRISIREFSEMLGLKGSTKYTEIKNLAKDLMSKTIEIPLSDGGWFLVNWISSAKYIKGEGVIELSFSPDLKPYLLQLKNQFTSYKLSNVLSLKSTYAIRLYELMKKWQYVGSWKCTVEDLREKLGATTKSYSLYGNLKNKVLMVAISEVNDKTDISIRYNEIKKGRSVESIEFLIQHTAEKEIKLAPQEEQTTFLENEDVRDRLNVLADGYQFDRSYFEQMYQGALLMWPDSAEKELKILIQYVNDEESVKNPLGFIKSKLQIAWSDHSRGVSVTFATLKSNSRRFSGREEIIPDWFKQQESEDVHQVPDPDIEMKRKKLLEELNRMK